MEEVNGTKVTGSRNELVCNTSSMLEWKKNHLKVVGQRDTSPRKEEERKWMGAEIPEEEIERQRVRCWEKEWGRGAREEEARDVWSRAINFINLASFSLWFPFFFISFSNSWSLPPLFSRILSLSLSLTLSLGYPLWIFLFFAHPFVPATIQTFFHGWHSLFQSIHTIQVDESVRGKKLADKFSLSFPYHMTLLWNICFFFPSPPFTVFFDWANWMGERRNGMEKRFWVLFQMLREEMKKKERVREHVAMERGKSP